MAARISMADVASSILDASLPAGPPILARRRGPERRLAEAKAEEREAVQIQKAKRALSEQPHRDLRRAGLASDPALETNLRKIATRGVVQLFNAVRSAQKDDDDGGGRKAKRSRKEQQPAARESAAESNGSAQRADGDASAELSRDSFLDILRRGTGAKPAVSAAQRNQPSAAEAKPPPGASFLRDDFMLGRHRAKDWEREAEEEEEGFVDAGAIGADEDDGDEDD